MISTKQRRCLLMSGCFAETPDTTCRQQVSSPARFTLLTQRLSKSALQPEGRQHPWTAVPSFNAVRPHIPQFSSPCKFRPLSLTGRP